MLTLSRRLAVLAALALSATACERGGPTVATYHPRTRAVTITTVPLLVKEMQGSLPFLKADFAKGGVLDGQEVYGFSPSTITAYAGDTLRLTFVNPEDDEHSFVLPDLYVKLPGQSVTTATYVTHAPGIHIARCAIPSHTRSMWATLVVLPPADAAP